MVVLLRRGPLPPPGIELSPLRAAAATIPMIVAYDATVGPSATTRIDGAASVRRDPRVVRKYNYGEAFVGYDGSSNLRAIAGAGVARAYDDLEHTDWHEFRREGAIYDAAASMIAADGVPLSTRRSCSPVRTASRRPTGTERNELERRHPRRFARAALKPQRSIRQSAW